MYRWDPPNQYSEYLKEHTSENGTYIFPKDIFISLNAHSMVMYLYSLHLSRVLLFVLGWLL